MRPLLAKTRTAAPDRGHQLVRAACWLLRKNSWLFGDRAWVGPQCELKSDEFVVFLSRQKDAVNLNPEILMTTLTPNHLLPADRLFAEAAATSPRRAPRWPTSRQGPGPLNSEQDHSTYPSTALNDFPLAVSRETERCSTCWRGAAARGHRRVRTSFVISTLHLAAACGQRGAPSSPAIQPTRASGRKNLEAGDWSTWWRYGGGCAADSGPVSRQRRLLQLDGAKSLYPRSWEGGEPPRPVAFIVATTPNDSPDIWAGALARAGATCPRRSPTKSNCLRSA